MKQYIQVQKMFFGVEGVYIHTARFGVIWDFVVLVPSIFIARNHIVIYLNHHYVLILLY